MTVDAGYVEWLRSMALYASATDAALAARWGDRAVESEILSPIALKADADAEAARQLAFFGGPVAFDVEEVAGRQVGLIGCAVTFEGEAEAVFVINAQELVGGRTQLVVIRRL